MRCYRRLLNISYKDLFTNVDIRRTFKQPFLTPDLGQETETKVVWTCHKVFWLSKDNSAGHSARKRRKGRQKKRWEDSIKGWTGMDFASSTRAAEDRTRWKGIVVKSSAVPLD